MRSFSLIPDNSWFDYDLKVTLKPSFRCNQRCWFCSEWNNSTPMWSMEDCDKVMDKLHDIPKDRKKIFFYLYGGEPTLSEHWEYIQYKIIEMFPERELFIQTQTNMSLKSVRLDQFLSSATKIKQDSHTIDICSSYHIGKQPVEEFLTKMDICAKYDSLGYSFFSTEVKKEAQFLSEFKLLANEYPDKMKLKFTQLTDLADTHDTVYAELLRDEYLLGDDRGESLEYRYFMRKYPELERYLEHSWTFDVDGTAMNYAKVKSTGTYRKFKYMKCAAGKKNIVIDHNLKAYRCNDYYYSNIEPIHIDELDINNFISKYNRCLSCKCTDGLDHRKVLY